MKNINYLFAVFIFAQASALLAVDDMDHIEVQSLSQRHQTAFAESNFNLANDLAFQLAGFHNMLGNSNAATSIWEFIDFYRDIRAIRNMGEASPDDNLFEIALNALRFYANQESPDLRLIRELAEQMVGHRNLASPADQLGYLEPIAQARHTLVENHHMGVLLGHHLGAEHPVVEHWNHQLVDQIEHEVRTVRNDPLHLDTLANLLDAIGGPLDQAARLRERAQALRQEAAARAAARLLWVQAGISLYNDALQRSAFRAAEGFARELVRLFEHQNSREEANRFRNAATQNGLRATLREIEESNAPNLVQLRELMINPNHRYELIVEDAQQDLLTQLRQERSPLVRDHLIVQLLQGQHVMQSLIDTINEDIEQHAASLEWLVGDGLRGMRNLAEQYLRMNWSGDAARLLGRVAWVTALMTHLRPSFVYKH